MPKSIITCADCAVTSPLAARSRCTRCYNRLRRSEAPEQYRNYARRFYKRHAEREKQRHYLWTVENRAWVRAYDREYRQRPGSPRLRSEKAKSSFISKFLRWLLPAHRRELNRIYRECPAGMQVDHIVPIKGENVCGLHVPWNLQYLTPEENRRKRNTFPA